MRKKLLLAILLSLTCACSANQSGGLLEKAMNGQAQIIDLTYPLNARTPYWPGGTYTPFSFETIATIEKDKVFSGRFTTPEHLGTHVDAPNHFVAGQIPVDQIPVSQLIAPAVVINVKEKAQNNADYQLTPEDIRQWESEHAQIPTNAVVFLYTGWSDRYWDYPAYKNQDSQGAMHFPGFSPDSARFLVNERKISGIGIDTLSVDYGLSKDFQVHHITHGAGKYHVENAGNLDKLPARGAVVIVAPIKIEGGSGGPARIFAIIP